MHEYPELHFAREALVQQNELYRPSAFWDEASADIVKELTEGGVENFRAMPKALSFFVPTYGSPGNSFTKKQASELKDWLSQNYPNAKKSNLALNQFLTGEASALSDYRVLMAADDPTRLPRLHTFSESTVGNPVEHFNFDGRRFSRSSLNYLLGLALLKKHLNVSDVLKNVLEIGGGFGTLGELMSHSGIEGARYIDVDIPPTSFVAQHYLQEVLGVNNVTGYKDTFQLSSIEIDTLPQASVLCSWQIEKLKGNLDLFVNFISFQEMEPNIVQNYLKHVDRLSAKWVLLRNMREGKQVKKEGSVGVKIPVKTEDYLTMLPGYELVEKNVLPFGYRTVDSFHSELLLLKRKA